MPYSLYRSRLCPCGSGLQSSWQFDARGIECCRTCDQCHDIKMARYRPEVLTDANYATDDQVEPD